MHHCDVHRCKQRLCVGGLSKYRVTRYLTGAFFGMTGGLCDVTEVTSNSNDSTQRAVLKACISWCGLCK